MTTDQPVEVSVLVIYHCRGIEVFPCVSRAIADEKLDMWVQEWWSTECKGVEMPKTPEARIKKYFAKQQQKPVNTKCCCETYAILKRDLLDKNSLRPKKVKKKVGKTATPPEEPHGTEEEPDEG